MRSTRTATTPTPPPITTSPTWSTNAQVTRTTSTLRTGNLLLESPGIFRMRGGAVKISSSGLFLLVKKKD